MNLTQWFDESPGCYLVEMDEASASSARKILAQAGATLEPVGTVQAEAVFQAGAAKIPVERLAKAWRGTLDW